MIQAVANILDYPCLCVAHRPVNDRSEARVEFSDKDTSAVVETVDRAQSCADSESVSSSLSLTREDVGRKSSAATDSENDCSCSKCDGATSSCQSTNTENSSGESGSANRSGNLSSESSRGGGSRTDIPESRNEGDEMSKEPLAKKGSSKEVNEGKTTVVLELIREEKEKQSVKTGEESKGCNCDIKNYDERLKKLESLCFPSGTTGTAEPNGTAENVPESHHPCDCATTILHFAEIKLRIDALEKLYTDSIEEEKGKKGIKLLSENVDEGTRTAIELAKIKKRLIDLEMKIINSNINSRHSTDQRVKKVSSPSENGELSDGITRDGETGAASQESHKEIHGIRLEKEPESRAPPQDDWKYVNDDARTAFLFPKETEPLDVAECRDEAMQTTSTSFHNSSDEGQLRMENGFRPGESTDKIRFCNQCHYYVTQELEPIQRKRAENPWVTGQPYENFERQFITENSGKGRKCLGEHPIKYPDILRAKASGKLRSSQEKRYYPNKPKRDYKNLKLCTKYPTTNLNEIFASNYLYDVEYEEECQPFLCDADFRKRFESDFHGGNGVFAKSKDAKNPMENVRLPHQSFHIYRSQQTRHSLFFPAPTPSPPEHTGRKTPSCGSREDEAEIVGEGRGTPFPRRRPSETRQRKAFHPAIAGGPQEKSDFEKMNPRNAAESKKTGRKMKMAGLFREVGSSSRNKTFAENWSSSADAVGGSLESRKNALNPWNKILRKLSHSHSLDNKMKWDPFGLAGSDSENRQNVKKGKIDDKNIAFKLNSFLKRSWIS